MEQRRKKAEKEGKYLAEEPQTPVRNFAGRTAARVAVARTLASLASGKGWGTPEEADDDDEEFPPGVRIDGHPTERCNGEYRMAGMHEGWPVLSNEAGMHCYRHDANSDWRRDHDPNAVDKWLLRDKHRPKEDTCVASIPAAPNGALPTGEKAWQCSIDDELQEHVLRVKILADNPDEEEDEYEDYSEEEDQEEEEEPEEEKGGEKSPTSPQKSPKKKAKRRRRKRKKARCHCGTEWAHGPGCVALRHALVYGVGWGLIGGIRMALLPPAHACFSPDVWPSLPGCPAVTVNSTEAAGVNGTAVIPAVGETPEPSAAWATAPSGLPEGGWLPAGLCWLWSRLRLMHLPPMACLQEHGGAALPPLFALSCLGTCLVVLAWIADFFWLGSTALIYLDGKQAAAAKRAVGKGANTARRTLALNAMALTCFAGVMGAWSVAGLGARPVSPGGAWRWGWGE